VLSFEDFLGSFSIFMLRRRVGISAGTVQGPAMISLAAPGHPWEVVAGLQDLKGSEEHRISLLAAESDLHPRLVRIALDYAAEHADEVRERIERNREMTERSRTMARQRESLLA
jgi:hypothetical protein